MLMCFFCLQHHGDSWAISPSSRTYPVTVRPLIPWCHTVRRLPQPPRSHAPTDAVRQRFLATADCGGVSALDEAIHGSQSAICNISRHGKVVKCCNIPDLSWFLNPDLFMAWIMHFLCSIHILWHMTAVTATKSELCPKYVGASL